MDGAARMATGAVEAVVAARAVGAIAIRFEDVLPRFVDGGAVV